MPPPPPPLATAPQVHAPPLPASGTVPAVLLTAAFTAFTAIQPYTHRLDQRHRLIVPTSPRRRSPTAPTSPHGTALSCQPRSSTTAPAGQFRRPLGFTGGPKATLGRGEPLHTRPSLARLPTRHNNMKDEIALAHPRRGDAPAAGPTTTSSSPTSTPSNPPGLRRLKRTR